MQITKGEQADQLAAKELDKLISTHINDALWQDLFLRLDYDAIEITVKDQLVFLRGYVRKAAILARVKGVVNSISDILGVEYAIYLDHELTIQVAKQLGQIEYEPAPRLFTGVRHGLVTLNGKAQNMDIRLLAEKYATWVPGIRGVLNYIRIPEHDHEEEDQRFLQPLIGEQIYFSDGPSGRVAKVVINPNNKRVIAFVIDADFKSGQVVVPTTEIRYLTKESGFLNIKSTDTQRYQDLDLTLFTLPEIDWDVPFPYYPENVLIPAELRENMNQTPEEINAEIIKRTISPKTPAINEDRV